MNWPFCDFSTLVYWGGTSVDNKAKTNLSQQFCTAHCQPDGTVQNWCNKPTFMQCSAEAGKLYSAKLLAGEWVSSGNSFYQHSQRMSSCKVAHCMFNYTSLPSLWNFTAEQTSSQHSPQIPTHFPPLDTQISPHRKAWFPRWPMQSFRKSLNLHKKTRKAEE